MYKRQALDEVISRATVWSETCGTAFYKVFWEENGQGGRVRVAEVPPFEIYPEDLSCASVAEQGSIMHVRALPVAEIERLYGEMCIRDRYTVCPSTVQETKQ